MPEGLSLHEPEEDTHSDNSPSPRPSPAGRGRLAARWFGTTNGNAGSRSQCMRKIERRLSMNRIKLEARSSPGNDLALTPALSPRRGGSDGPIFAMERFARWRQRIGDSTKSGVKAAALQDASDIRTGFKVPMHSKNERGLSMNLATISAEIPLTPTLSPKGAREMSDGLKRRTVMPVHGPNACEKSKGGSL